MTESPENAGTDALAATFAERLIAWQAEHGRHDLPWQNTRDAYRIWLSEIMLQQTQVATVIPYYTKFLERFPDVTALANAPQDDVMALWSGLGYYSRARNLHRCAQVVVAEHGARFPSDPQVLAALPGIGRSTAAAIAAFAYDAHAAILDGNVKRVLARVFGIEGFPGTPKIEREMWALAESLLPQRDLPAYTQGMMDLGATLCGRGKPRCGECPFDGDCVAHATGRERTLPTAKPKKAQPQRYVDVLVVRAADRVLFERRPDSGIWGGLWSLPELTPPTDACAPDDAALRARLTALAVTLAQGAENGLGAQEVAPSIVPLRGLTHVFTHFKLFLRPWLVTLPSASAAGSRHAWLDAPGMAAAGLPSPIRKIADALSLTVQDDGQLRLPA
ncbi:A/G-specific adenine glycosylase [Pandoraea pnomenusa]|uniref:Adenine DNA glycosylase n=1 Tax=Pandoraea pnomenusa TaxID=93220 RepID=A0A378YT59_9BURK|nr:A/G-specific adenine glycosylase [Pandoraea pnomenusa]AIU28034.1 A/G-specific adenine glycosylase [Pandoraea pnomenusa]SUA79717.1 A/G-specific adenine glycosylase [Pandoraea pnomenusa]